MVTAVVAQNEKFIKQKNVIKNIYWKITVCCVLLYVNKLRNNSLSKKKFGHDNIWMKLLSTQLVFKIKTLWGISVFLQENFYSTICRISHKKNFFRYMNLLFPTLNDTTMLWEIFLCKFLSFVSWGLQRQEGILNVDRLSFDVDELVGILLDIEDWLIRESERKSDLTKEQTTWQVSSKEFSTESNEF